MSVKQKDLLDKTEAFLAKRDGIDKARLCGSAISITEIHDREIESLSESMFDHSSSQTSSNDSRSPFLSFNTPIHDISW